ncbi:MAG TPA: SDR family NAD(P)-dependent oxidoreductase, partial [Phaeodactylibacter sp.]|nr:SDR family NAD(P)-dependent oxidoreductase [Phaeodactylibacter sp.]
MKNLKNKVVVITGAGSGIGRALAIEFDKLGAKLALNDFNEKTLHETFSFLNQNPFYDIFDVSDRAAVFQFAEKVAAHYNAVDVVINNAGIAMNGEGFQDIDLDK